MQAETTGVEDVLASSIGRLVGAKEPGAERARVERLERLGGGNARQAWAADVRWEVGAHVRREACVLLLQEEAGQLESDLAREFRVLAALEGSGVPAPGALWLDASGDFLGAPGFLMKRLPGVSDLRDLLKREEGERNRAIAFGMARALAALHVVAFEGQDLGAVPEPEGVAHRQVDYWEGLFLQHRMEPHPVLTDAFAWLREQAPRAQRVAVVHGDFRFGNVLYEGSELRGILDWEMAHLGDPCEDLAWAYHPLWTPAASLDFGDFVAAYEEAAGLRLPRFALHYYRLFSEVKHAVISLTGARAFASGRSPHLRLADRMTWVPECLIEFRRLLRDAPAAEVHR